MRTEVYEDGSFSISIRLDEFEGRENDYYFLKYLEEEKRRLAEEVPEICIPVGEWVHTSVTRCSKPGRRHKNESKISWVENGF